MKTRISVEEVRQLQERRREINRLDLSEIEWVEDGKVVDVPPERIEDWKFTGLNTTDFIDTDFYREGWQDERGGDGSA